MSTKLGRHGRHMARVDRRKNINFGANIISVMDPEWLFNFFDMTFYDFSSTCCTVINGLSLNC